MSERKNFEDPDVIRIPMSDGVNWIEIKKYLNIFDQRRAEAAGIVHIMVDDKDPAGNPTRKMVDVIDWSVYDVARTEIWVKRWLMLDNKGEPSPLTVDAIKSLSIETFEEISMAIFNRIIEIAKEKKLRLEERAAATAAAVATAVMVVPPASFEPTS